MKTWHKIKWILALASLLATFILCTRCTPQQKLDRLVKRHPELVQSDTATGYKEVLIPGFRIDTAVATAGKNDYTEIYQVLDTYSTKIDSLTMALLKKQLGTYIINRQCLEAPVTIPFGKGGIFKVWQVGGRFFFDIHHPDTKQTIKVPIHIMRVEAVTRYSWQMFIGGFFTGWLLLCAFCMLVGPLFKKKLENGSTGSK